MPAATGDGKLTATTARASPEVTRGARPRSIAGARVLELGGYLAAPFGSLLLANLGAEVIKVESLRGDETRHLRLDRTFIASNAGKRSIAIDLKSEPGAEVFARLVRTADIVLHNLSERATEQLKVTYEACRQIKRDIVYAQITGFGDGPYAGRMATNPLIEAMVGTTLRTNGKPTRMGGAYYDQLAGALAALAAVAALASDSSAAAVRNIRIGLFELGLYVDGSRLTPRVNQEQKPNPSGAFASPAYDAFKAADGWVYVGAVSDPLWRKLCQGLGLNGALADPTLATPEQRWQRRDEVTALVAQAIGVLPSKDVIERLDAAGVPCVPVYENDDVLRDEHMQVPGKLTATRFKGKQIELGAFPVVGAGAPRPISEAAPLLGEHSIEILRSLGYSDEEHADLIRRGRVVSSAV